MKHKKGVSCIKKNSLYQNKT